MLNLLESILLFALTTLITKYQGEVVGFFTRIGDKLNDKVEETATQLDDAGKDLLVKGLEAMIVELKVEGAD